MVYLTGFSAAIAMSAFALGASTQAQEGSETYTADIQPLNAGGDAGIEEVTGTATFTIDGDELMVEVQVSGVAPGVAHPMHVHLSNACPAEGADENDDGFIDVIEGVPDYGEILIPLDSDLDSQSAGDFPMANDQGEIDYSQTVSISTMMADLQAQDDNPDDAVVKLDDDEELDLESRSIVVHGAAQDVQLPDTVQSLGEAPANVTLPVACGVMEMDDEAAGAAGATGATGAGETPEATGATGATGAGETPEATNTPAGQTPGAAGTPEATGTPAGETPTVSPGAQSTPGATQTPSTERQGEAAKGSGDMAPPTSGSGGLLDPESKGPGVLFYGGIAALITMVAGAAVCGFALTRRAR